MAVKVFRLDLTPEQASALAEALQGLVEIGLDHPSVVAPLAAGVEGHAVYVAEEYVAAESLDVALRHYAPAAPDTALPLLAHLAGAIDFARARGVGHGALHPRDIFVAPEIARATGFGVVQALERLGLRAPVRRPYSAPERVAGASWSTQADVFALGAVAHELLTGKRPVGPGEVAPIAGGAPEAHTARLRAVLACALADDPAARYASAMEFVRALEAAAQGESMEAHEGTRRPQEPRRRKRRSHEVAMAAAGEQAGPAITEEPSLLDLASAGPPAAGEAPPEQEAAAVHTPEAQAIEVETPIQAPHALDEAPPDAGDERLEEAAWPSELPREPVDDLLAPSERSYVPDEPVAPLADSTYPPMAAQGRTAILPFAIVAVVSLLAGFLAGYLFGSREQVPATTKEWSEAAVEPAAAPRQAAPSPPAAPLRAEPPAAAKPRAEILKPASTAPPAGAQAQSPSVRPPAAAAARRGQASQAAPRRQAAPPPAATGTLVADSRPAGARVIVDGRAVGKTPLRLSGVKAGPHTVRFELQGYRAWATEISVTGGSETRVAGSLEAVRNR